ncbi:MAG TPA: ABC transporter permease [Acidobacteriota bacterium]|nr:ABC transporter permease [Acidobacteriota bacterium]
MAVLFSRIMRLGRPLRRRPGASLLAIAALGMGMAACLTVASLADQLVLRPMSEASDLMLVWGSRQTGGQQRDVLSGPNFLDLRRETRTFLSMAAVSGADASLVRGGRVEPLSALRVTPGFFATMGIDIAVGRAFQPSDGQGSTVVPLIITHGLWQRLWAGDEGILEQRMDFLAGPARVVGVLPRGFHFPYPADVFRPIDTAAMAREQRSHIDYHVVGRLAPGTTARDANRDLNAILDRVAQDHPAAADWDVLVEPYGQASSSLLRPGLALLGVVVGLTLLMACANVAGLLAAESLRRRREFGLRSALGASRRQLAGQLLGECLILCSAGGALGVLLTLGILEGLKAFVPPQFAIPGSAVMVTIGPIGVTWAGLAAVFLLIPSAALLCLPASLAHLASPRTSGFTLELLRSAGRGSSRQGRARTFIVSAQIALATLTLCVSGWAVQRNWELTSIDPGLEPQGVLAMYFGQLHDRDASQRALYYRQVIEAVESIPGVRSAAVNDYIPFQNEDDFEGFHLPGQTAPHQRHREEWRRVSPRYFETAGVRLIEGRFFDQRDNERSPSVAVINQAMARRYWGGKSPLGERFILHSRPYGDTEVVGVVSDVRRRGLAQAAPAVIYVPLYRAPRPVMALFVRPLGDANKDARGPAPASPEELSEQIKQALWSVDGRQPIETVQTLDSILATSLSLHRAVNDGLLATALAALLLSAFGVYALTSQTVQARWGEMGIRSVLGAGQGHILRCLLRDSLKTLATGTAMGALLSLLLASRLSSSLFVSLEGTPGVLASAAGLVALVTLAAALRPIWRLSRSHPLEAIRHAG